MSQANISKGNDKPTKRRWFVLFLVCIITFINYLDRANISVAAPFISSELGFDAAKMGLIFSAMSWSYTCMQIPCGWVLERLGPRIVYGIALFGWSAFTGAMSLTYNFTSMILCRM